MKWANRSHYFDDSGLWVADRKPRRNFDRPLSCSRLKEQGKIRFELMTRKLVADDPGERTTVAELVELIPDTWSVC